MNDILLLLVLLGGLVLLGILFRDKLNWKWALGALGAVTVLWGVFRTRRAPEAPAAAPPPPPEPGAATEVAQTAHAVVEATEAKAREAVQEATGEEIADILRGQK